MANEFKVKKGLIVDGSNTVLDIQGTQGQLFSVTDSLTGDLFSVSDVSGIPIFNVNSSGMSTFDGDVTIDKDSARLILQDNSTGNSLNQWISYRDSASVERAYLGYGSSSNSVFYIVNNLSDLKFYAGGVLNETKSGAASTFLGNIGVGGNIDVGGTVTMSASGNIFSDSNFQFLNTGSGAQVARFAGIQLSTSYSGTIPSQGILFGTDTNLYRSAANTLKTDDDLVVLGDIDVRGDGTGYNAIRIVNNTTADANKQTGITTLNYAGNNVSIMQYATNANRNTVYYGSADGAHSGLSAHKFMVNADPDTPGSGHTTALHISSDTNAEFSGEISQIYDPGNTGAFQYLKNVNSGDAAYVSKKWQNDDSGFGEIWRNSSTRNSGVGNTVSSFNMYNSSAINFWSGTSLSLTLDASQNATFAGEISAGDDINASTKIVIGESSTPELRIKKTNAGNGKVSFYNNDGSSSTQQAYLNLDASEDLVMYSAANNDNVFYAGGVLNSTQSSANTTFSGNVTINGGQILTPGGVDLSLNPNTGLVNIGGVIRATGTGANKFTGGLVLGTPSNGNLANKLTIASGTNGDGIFLTGLGTAAGMGTGHYKAIDYQYSNTDSSFGSAIRFVTVDSTIHGGQIQLWTDDSSGNIQKALTLDKSQDATFAGDVTIGALTTGETARLVVNHDGGASPVAKFMSRTNKSIVQISDNDTTGYVSSENGYFSMGRAAGVNAANINIDSGSNVGIGISSGIANKLHVVGDVLFSSHSSSATSRSTNGVGINFTNNNTFSSNGDLTDGNRFFAITNDSTTANAYAPLSFRVNPSGGTANAMADIKLVANGSDHHLTTTMRNPVTDSFLDVLSIKAEGGLDVQGSVGQLFSVTNSLTGDLFSVSDVSGVPIFNVNSSGLSTFDGNVLVGKTTVDSSLAGVQLETNGSINPTVSGDTVARFNRLTSDGEVIRIQKDTATVGAIGCYNGVPWIGYQGGAGGGIMFNGASIEPTLLGSSRSSNTNDIGSVTYKWRYGYFGTAVNTHDLIATNSSVLSGPGSGTSTVLTVNHGAGSHTGIGIKINSANSGHAIDLTGTVGSGYARLTSAYGNNPDFYTSGTITAGEDVIAYSDLKLKENIKTLDGSKVYSMRGVSFTRKDTEKHGSGVIAQEMQKIAPELVNEIDGTLGVSYGNITGYLIEAIKDLKQEIEELKKQIK